MAIKNTNHVYFVKAQYPLDIKTVYSTKQDLIDDITNDNIAKTFYKGLTIYILEDNSIWRWQEYDHDENKTWLSDTGYMYPDCWKNDYFDYSGKEFNFVRLYAEQLYYITEDNPDIATYILVFDTIQDLRDYKSSPLNGETALVKETQYIYKFNSTNTDTDDNLTVIVPTGGDNTGRWLLYETYARKDLSNVSDSDALNQFGDIFFRVDQNNNPQSIVNGKPLLVATIDDTDDSNVFVNKDYVDNKDNEYDTNLKGTYLPANYASINLGNVNPSDIVNRLNSNIVQPLPINVQYLGGSSYTDYATVSYVDSTFTSKYVLDTTTSWTQSEWHRIVNLGSSFDYKIFEVNVYLEDGGGDQEAGKLVINTGGIAGLLVTDYQVSAQGIKIIDGIRLVEDNGTYFIEVSTSGAYTMNKSIFVLRILYGQMNIVSETDFAVANPENTSIISTLTI